MTKSENWRPARSGATVSSRFGQIILAERIAAKIQKRPPPTRILKGALSFVLTGADLFQLQVPKSTILINALAGLPLLVLLI